eukprot:CAMPEP_0194114890 /NCGR_PEP_ID=MMETSP0150-20130528/21793_1 /TAXON_ID=122233 /ORGANISM="Chaetoceros debilis, Strain MM31A-1" /LENGTH=39 /DNA_ID= /DNA_START= /DNA_END= /DNA_ORIENTATION=
MDASKKSDRGDGWHIDKSKSSNGFYDSGDREAKLIGFDS